MSTKDAKQKTQRLVITAFLIALIFVLQLVANFFKVGAVSISLVLIPITVGSVLLGPAVGAVLGCAFGVVCFLYGLFGLDPFTMSMIAYNPLLTALICLVKGIAAALACAYVYKLMAKLCRGNVFVSTLIASLFTPLVNTGLFLLGSVTVFKGFFEGDGEPIGTIVLLTTLIGSIAVNFIFEIVSNAVLSPTVANFLSKSKSFKQFCK